MSRLRSLLTAACATGLLIGHPASAHDQVADSDWDYAEDVARKSYVASVSFASGQELIAQCVHDDFGLFLWGLPNRGQAPYTATVQIGSTPVTQVWRRKGAWLSTEPARDARALRNGGVLPLSSSGSRLRRAISSPLELPSRHANLDKVLTACGYALEDDRDHLPDVDADMRLQGVRRQPTLDHEDNTGAELSCLVTNGQLEACRPHRTPQGFRLSDIQQEARQWNGKPVHPRHAQANEGRVAHITIPMVQVVAGP